jgi:hypothetical protein
MSLSRRRLLAVTGGSLVALAGCAGPGADLRDLPSRESATCVPRSALTRHGTLAGLPLVYEVNQRRSDFWFDAGFHGQLERWFATFTATAGITAPDEVGTYGSWIDGGSRCDSWHHAGRAFDLSRLAADGTTLVSCRYDRWQHAADLVVQRRRYWALVASLHRDFAYVLTYLYDAQHHNHVHVDNGRSGPGLSELSTRSGAQVQAVQAMLSYLWDQPVEITGSWDAATRAASRTVLDRLEIAADLDGSTEAWHGFLSAGTRRFAVT